jgi:hypothetical protein
VSQVPNKKDPDGPLHKWGEPEGVKDFKNKTPGQDKMSDKEIKEADMNKKSARKRLSDILSGRKPGAMKPKKGKGSYDRKKQRSLEELKQINELTKKTIQRYQDQAALHHRDAKAAGATEIQKRREKGHDLADKKLAGKTKVGATGKLSDYPYRKEDVEQVDELDKSTLQSYKKKSELSAKAGETNASHYPEPQHAWIKNTFKARAAKRRKGIELANKKLAREEVDGLIAKINEASLKMRIAKKGKVENELKKIKSSSGEMAAFLLNQSADNDTRDLRAFLKSKDADKDVLKVFKKHMPELLK